MFLMGGMDQSEKDQITFKSVVMISFLSFLSTSLFVDVVLFLVNVSARLHVVCILWTHM